MPQFPSTRQAALRRLEDFLALAQRYGSERNYVLPGHDNVSRLSAAIRHRLITEEEVVDAALRKHAFCSVEKWLQEVLWRGYWRGWLEVRPQLWDAYLESTRSLPSQMEPAQILLCREVAEGRSQSGIMNLFARELQETGYLHNHARMWWASYWIHHCRLPWELGARHFLHHLLDADPASNTLSWRWVAGLQTQGKTYMVTAQNMEKFCSPELLAKAGGVGLYDLTPALVPEQDPKVTAAMEIPDLPDHLDAELPQSRTALILHDEDLCLETSPAAGLEPTIILQFIPNPSPPISSVREEWLAHARADAAKRAAEHFHSVVRVCQSHAEIAAACVLERVNRVVMMEPFVGPLRDHIRGLAPLLAAQNMEWVGLRRVWDAKLQPFAMRGFFPFWSKVGSILKKSGIQGLT